MCAVVLYYNMISCFKFTHLSEQQGRLEKANIEYVVLAGSSLFLCEWCTLCEMCLHIGRDRIVFVKGKWRSRVSKKLKIFRPRRGGASRPARPRRLEAGAARLWLFTKKHMFFLHLIGARPPECAYSLMNMIYYSTTGKLPSSIAVPSSSPSCSPQRQRTRHAAGSCPADSR